jgi:hypothetical protein
MTSTEPVGTEASTGPVSASVARGRPAADARHLVVDGVFVALTLATMVCWYFWTRSLTFLTDDWGMIDRGRSFVDLFRPFNGHLSVVPIAVWRASYHLFGLRTYTPLVLVGIVSLTLVGVSLFLEARARVGSAVALVAGTIVLWYPALTIAPQTFNHYLALAAGVLCASALRRERSSPYLLAGALTFSLCSSGVGVAVAAGCVGYVLISRPPVRRWVAVLVPTGGWLVWWLLVAHQSTPPFARSYGEQASFVWHGIVQSFAGLTFGNRAGGVVLAAVFVVSVAWRCRHSLRAGCGGLAWTVGLLAWWVGLALSRGLLASPDRGYYDLIGTVFVLLAAVPEHLAPSRLRVLARREVLAAAIVIAALVVLTSQAAIRDRTHDAVVVSDRVRTNLAVVLLGRDVVPDGQQIPLGFFTLTAGRLRQLVHAYGAPPGTRPADPDAALIRPEALGILPRPAPHSCRILTKPLQLTPDDGILLHSTGGEVAVQLRRFGDRYRTITTIPPGGTIALVVPAWFAVVPWQLQASGACTPSHH